MAFALLATLGVWQLATPEQQLEVVSGRAQPKRTNSGQAHRWWAHQVHVNIDASVEALGPEAADAIVHAFGSWLTADGLPRFQFDSRPRAPTLTRADGENRVYYAPIDIKGHEHDLAVTVSFVDESTGEILEADIIINSRQPFAVVEVEEVPISSPSDEERGFWGEPDGDESRGGASEEEAADRRDEKHGRDGRRQDPTEEGDAVRAAGESDDDADHRAEQQAEPVVEVRAMNCGREYDLESVVAHEVGHFLGLGEDMTDSDATMYARTGRCEVKKRLLSPADISEVMVLYGEAPPVLASTTAAPACGVALVRARTSGGAAGGLGALLLLLCGRRSVRRWDVAPSPASGA